MNDYKDLITIEQALANEYRRGYKAAIAELEKAEPVAWMSATGESFVNSNNVGNSVPNWEDYYTVPLYLHPSDDENLREDAARYRWLRSPKVGHHKVSFWMNEPAMFVDLNWNDLDYAIDAARAAEGGG